MAVEKVYKIKESMLVAIADAIRKQTDSKDLIEPENMPLEITLLVERIFADLAVLVGGSSTYTLDTLKAHLQEMISGANAKTGVEDTDLTDAATSLILGIDEIIALVGGEYDENTLVTLKEQLQSMIDSANSTTGNSDADLTVATNALIAGYGVSDDTGGDSGGDDSGDSGDSGAGGGNYEGLENGYDVMFYDENSDALAFYSIKQGHSINSPIYDCDGWKDAEGNIVEFPFTPSGDVSIFSIILGTLADQMYEHFNVDKGVYPYLAILVRVYSSGTTCAVCFAQTVQTNTFNELILDVCKVSGDCQMGSDYDPSDYETGVQLLCNWLDESSLSEKESEYRARYSSAYIMYTNFECLYGKNTTYPNYRLDQ